MRDSSDVGPSADVLAFVARHLRTPAELDLLMRAHRLGRACTTEELAVSTGLRPTHAQLCIDSLVAAGVLTSSDGRHRVADGAAESAMRVAAVFDRFRLRLVTTIMDAWSDG